VNFWEFLRDGTAGLGYRVARHVAGYGMATAAVRALGRRRRRGTGLRKVRAAAFREKAASGRCRPTPGPARLTPLTRPASSEARHLVSARPRDRDR